MLLWLAGALISCTPPGAVRLEAHAPQAADTAARDSGDTSAAVSCDGFSDPVSGTEAGDGSAAAPWPSLEALAAAGSLPTAGTLCLMPGDHGEPTLKDLDAPELVIQSYEAHQAWVGSLRFVNARNIEIRDLLVEGLVDPAVDERDTFLVQSDTDSSELTLRGLLVRSAPESSGWTVEDWSLRTKSGIDLRGTGCTVLDTTIVNTHHALSLRGDHAVASGNLIDNFGGDGIRGLGSHSTYAWNTVRDAYIDEYELQHDDAFQAYELEGDLKIEDVWIHHNAFLLFADPITDFVIEEGLVGTLMQGVLISDGFADGWTVENNLVVNASAHGISLYGGRSCRVQNNTVIAHPAFEVSSGPWIRISDQTKTGQANFSNIIRNNVTSMLTPWDYDESSLVEHNLEAEELGAIFVDPASLDFRLLPEGLAVDAGASDDLSETDLDGNARLVGAAVDLGAFEVQTR